MKIPSSKSLHIKPLKKFAVQTITLKEKKQEEELKAQEIRKEKEEIKTQKEELKPQETKIQTEEKPHLEKKKEIQEIAQNDQIKSIPTPKKTFIYSTQT